MSATAPTATRPPPWQTCLDIEGQEAGHYLDYFNEPLLRCIDGTPRRVLDLGCATGMFGKVLKERFPGVHVTGLEPGRAAAALASTRLDRVICARCEDVDYAAEGIAPGSIDLVVAGDVLEHLPNPWKALLAVRPLVAPGGQLVVSIPNARNLQILVPLTLSGRFEYAERGPLDITHLRFFAFEDLQVMLDETGFALEGFMSTLARGYDKFYRENEHNERTTLQIGKLRLENLTKRELTELCTETWLCRVRPKA